AQPPPAPLQERELLVRRQHAVGRPSARHRAGAERGADLADLPYARPRGHARREQPGERVIAAAASLGAAAPLSRSVSEAPPSPPAPRSAPVPEIGGRCDPRFAAVRDAFAANSARRGEVGAAVAGVVGGRVVVDRWGGLADPARGTPWREDTLVNVFSVTKALVTICALRLVEEGRLGLDEPLARAWPG